MAAKAKNRLGLLAEQSRESGVASAMVTHDHGVLGHGDRVLEMTGGSLTATV